MIPQALLAAVRDGQVALVLGAGASLGAEHPTNNKALTAKELAAEISKTFLGGEHADRPLSIVAEYAIAETDLRAVQDFLHELFRPYRPGQHHRLLPTFKWHGIATTNYDLVIERAYEKSLSQRIRPVISNRDRIEDAIRTPSDLLLLKLHGCITRTADPEVPLILTPDQYVTHRAGRSRLFERLESWGAEKPLVFVGTTIDDSDLRQIILKLSSDLDHRPRYYLVEPFASDIMVRSWERRKVTVVQSDFDRFLRALDEGIDGIARALAVAKPALPIFRRFSTTPPVLSEAARQALEFDYTFVAPELVTAAVDPHLFYRGFTTGWGAIEQDLDCTRDTTDELLLDIVLDDDHTRPAELVVLKAPAGAGKSVLLKRIAWQAAKDLNAICLFANGRLAMLPEVLDEIAEQLDGRLYLFVDDVADNVNELERLLSHATKKNLAITFIGAERNNEWNVSCDTLVPYVVAEYALPYLKTAEIDALLDLLERHDSLDRLKNKSREEQRHAFAEIAGRQLLVALHEATLGRPFEEILKNEFEAIVPDAAQRLYLTVCTLNRTGTPVRAGLISRVHGIPFSRFKEAFFKPLEHVVSASLGHRHYDYEYRARHSHIADIVFQLALPTPEARYEKIMSIVSALDVSYETDRRSFRDLVNAKSLRELIGSASLIEAIFGMAQERASEDGHVWLQHGLFEMRRDGADLKKAAELLACAHARMPRSELVSHSYAELELVRAMSESSPLVREKHLKEAKRLATTLLGKHAKGSYGYHTIFKVEHMRLRRALEANASATQADDVARAIRDAEHILSEGLQQFPGDVTLVGAEGELASTLQDNERARAALERAVSLDPKNASIVGRLARILSREGKVEDAKAMLERGIAATPGDRRLNYGLAMLLIESDADGSAIEFHLRRAFMEGDRNLDAQFLYARQLYINGKISDARARFAKLKNESVDLRTRNTSRRPWTENSKPKRFCGRVSRVARHYALIQRDGENDVVTVQVHGREPHPLGERMVGDRVSFGISFNFHGPIATDIGPEW